MIVLTGMLDVPAKLLISAVAIAWCFVVDAAIRWPFDCGVIEALVAIPSDPIPAAICLMALIPPLVIVALMPQEVLLAAKHALAIAGGGLLGFGVGFGLMTWVLLFHVAFVGPIYSAEASALIIISGCVLGILAVSATAAGAAGLIRPLYRI